jgi:DNA-binding YbaB/EbfC family protein
MKNLGQMLKQAQQMQTRMAEMQKKLEAHEVDGESGGGMVRVTLTGKGEARRVKIDPSIVSASEVEILEDLIVAAINDAKAKLEAHLAEEMAKIAGGLSLPPGMKLPF